MKKLLTILTVVLCLCMVFSFIACNNNDDEVTQANPNVVAIAGDYLLDGSTYGMPMSWYINIGADETFKISTKRDYSVDKGKGSVKEQSGTFMFIYSDSTVDTPKTCTFTIDNGNLSFDGKVYVGSASVSAEGKVLALTLANEAFLNEYVGTASKYNAMSQSTTEYEQTLLLKAGNQYRFESSFAMGLTTYLYAEEGTFTIDGTVLKLKALKKITSATIMTGELVDIETANIAEETGTIENNQVKINVYPSPMSSTKIETTLNVATTAEYAGTYTGSKFIQMMSTTYTASLVLDKVGGYKLTVNAYTEEGAFAVDGTTATFTATTAEYDGETTTIPDAYTLDLGTLCFTGKVPTGGPKTSMTLYSDAVQGTFTANDSDNSAELALNADGTFTLKAGADPEAYAVELNGTFAISSGMGTMITLTVTTKNGEAAELSLTGYIGSEAINVQDVPTDTADTTVSFAFAK